MTIDFKKSFNPNNDDTFEKLRDEALAQGLQTVRCPVDINIIFHYIGNNTSGWRSYTSNFFLFDNSIFSSTKIAGYYKYTGDVSLQTTGFLQLFIERNTSGTSTRSFINYNIDTQSNDCVLRWANNQDFNNYSCNSYQPQSISVGDNRWLVEDSTFNVLIDIPSFPIFDSQQRCLDYVNGINTDVTDALNYTAGDVEKEGNTFTIYNTGQRGTWSAGDIVTDISTPYYRWAKIKLASTNQVDGRLAFYKAGLEDGILKLKPKNVASVISCQFSTDGGANWIDYDSFPFEYIYAERTNELGTFIYATRSGLSGQTGVPVFDDEETATKWVNHDPDVDITQASNYEQISNRYPQSNKTGQKENSTSMGNANNFRSHFTQKYLLDRGDISIIVNALFDTSTNIFEDIKKGLEMFGEKIIDSICGLAFYPIDLTTVFSNLTPQSYIYFGGYQFTEAGFSVNRINSYNGYLDLGGFTIEPSYPDINDVRNYSPYCNVSIYLPYCGLFQLNYNKYVGKTVSVRYYIDINTGGCLVCLFADGLLYDYFNGTMATQIPITVTDYSGFANAELRNLSNLAGVGGNMATLGATGLASASAGAGQVGGVALGGASNLLSFEKSIYELSTTNINNFNSTKGSSGAIGNQYLPQYIYLIFEYIDVEETVNLIQLEGKPSNKSGAVNSFSGYLEVDSVNLICSGATESEKQEIEQLLHSGVII